MANLNKIILSIGILSLAQNAAAQTATPAASSQQQSITRSKSAPSFSRDGKRIVYVATDWDERAKSSSYHLRVVNTDGTGDRNLLDAADEVWSPRFSPDGKWIVFTQSKKGTDDIWLIGADGVGLKQLTKTPARESAVDFSSDGKSILFLRDADSQGGTPVRLSLADGRETNVTTDKTPIQDISSAPGGKTYVVCDMCGGEPQGLPAIKLISFDGSAPHLVMTRTGKIFKFRAAQAGRAGIAMEEQPTSEAFLAEQEAKMKALTNGTFSSGSSRKNQIHLVDAAKDETLIADAESNSFNFDISADGKQLVFTGRPNAQQPEALWLYDIEKKVWSRVMSPEESAKEQAQVDARKHYDSAMALGEARRFAEAIVEFTEAVKLAPNEPVIYRNRALTYGYNGDTVNALKDFAEVIRLLPNAPEAHAERGMLLAQTNRFDEAVVDFTEAIRLAPGNKQLYLTRAQLYRKLGKINLAVADEVKANSLSVK